MFQSTVVVLFSALALSSAWPPYQSELPARISKWNAYSNIYDDASFQTTSVGEEHSCKTAVGKIDEGKVNIRRSYHLCYQENPKPEEEKPVGKPAACTVVHFYCSFVVECLILECPCNNFLFSVLLYIGCLLCGDKYCVITTYWQANFISW